MKRPWKVSITLPDPTVGYKPSLRRARIVSCTTKEKADYIANFWKAQRGAVNGIPFEADVFFRP